LALAADGVAWEDAKPALVAIIAEENAGAETIRKVLEHVRRIWFEPPAACLPLHASALAMFRTSDTPLVRAVLNWGMSIAAYPFVGSVAESLGRLLKLQTMADRSAIQRRLREQYGDRAYVDRITRYTVSSFLDWNVVAEAKRTGVYTAVPKNRVTKPEQLAWLVEAVLISRGRTQLSITELADHPILFPFNLDTLSASTFQSNPRLRVERQSLNVEYVFLKNSPLRVIAEAVVAVGQEPH
jgi:hypothetical protein